MHISDPSGRASNRGNHGFTVTGLISGLAIAGVVAVICVPILGTQIERRARSAEAELKQSADSIVRAVGALDSVPASVERASAAPADQTDAAQEFGPDQQVVGADPGFPPVLFKPCWGLPWRYPPLLYVAPRPNREVWIRATLPGRR